MKRTLYILLLALALGVSGNAAPHQRHKANISVKVDSAGVDGSVEAVSDTTAAALGSDDDWEDNDSDNVPQITINGQQFDPAQYSNPISYFGTLWGLGVGGIMLALFIMAIILIILLLPVILLVLILRYLIRRHNDKVAMEREAYFRAGAASQCADATQEQGSAGAEERVSPQPKPTWHMQQKNITDEETWRKGVRFITVGVGLTMAAIFWQSRGLAGCGMFIACLGAGYVLIGMTSHKKGSGKKDHDADNDTSAQQ